MLAVAAAEVGMQVVTYAAAVGSTAAAAAPGTQHRSLQLAAAGAVVHRPRLRTVPLPLPRLLADETTWEELS